ncbi:MAG: alanine racemase [Planctomycetes bacterium]|nr:alanine racemase [Planctomycetota bacterium]
MDPYRVKAEIDLDALQHNLRVIRQRAGPGGRVMLVVKADAYGHGARAIANHALRCGIESLGVGTSAEALELRHDGVRAPILVLGTIIDDEARDCLRHRVQIALHSSDRRAQIQELARTLGVRAQVHLNVDTGMGRLGVLPGRALDLLREIRGSSHLELCGLMTHVSAAEGALADSTREQARSFEGVLSAARSEHLLRGSIHMANSAALFTGLRPLYDTVRPGISAYGILNPDLPGSGDLKPVLSLRTQIVFLKDVPAGTPIGYSSTWRAERATRIATLPVGYHDGVPWRLSNCGEVIVRGRRAPIVGRVTMDYITVDVGHIPGAAVGDTATLIGTDRNETITVAEVAEKAGTIAYEITCSVGRRVQRLYTGGENLELAAQRAPDPRNTPSAYGWTASTPPSAQPPARPAAPRESGREVRGS